MRRGKSAARPQVGQTYCANPDPATLRPSLATADVAKIEEGLGGWRRRFDRWLGAKRCGSHPPKPGRRVGLDMARRDGRTRARDRTVKAKQRPEGENGVFQAE